MAPGAKKLSDLATILPARLHGDGGVEVDDVTHDSRRVAERSMYIALVGGNFDGHEFVGDAVRRGAAAVCVERETSPAVPELVVDDTRAVVGYLAAAIHDHPSHSMDVIGVTGTNGKTTVTHYIDSIGRHAGRVTGLSGTIHTRIAGREVPSSMTTPEATEFQRLLADMRDAGVSLVAAEVSSHALEFGRVRATRFAVAAFTNLSQDHLDFHGDMRSYRMAKERLFREYEVGTAVVNVDDPVGAGIAAGYRGELVEVGTRGDVRVSDLTMVPGGSRFALATPWGSASVVTPVIGDFNVTNLAVAATSCLAVGVDFDVLVDGLAVVEDVPGRFEIISGDDPIVVIVDYAHTPEGVARAVETGRRLTGGKVIGLIGAGGDRDRAKRPAMGAAISEADLAIVTSDNPRSEDPHAIVAAVASGLVEGGEHVVEVDRRRAIDRAIREATDGDVVLILGRGHEPYQQVDGERILFDDRRVAGEALSRRRRSAAKGGESGSMAP
jgi:UDP-N-acetylmuramoyl-L-alanyl-D-glutamate--2,6-diaminopimelate ligase